MAVGERVHQITNHFQQKMCKIIKFQQQQQSAPTSAVCPFRINILAGVLRCKCFRVHETAFVTFWLFQHITCLNRQKYVRDL